MSGGDEYRVVTARFRGISASRLAIFIDRPRAPGKVTVPRSLLHGGDDVKVDGLKAGAEFTFRLREWKAEELGLA